jgi:Fe2+ or Zn2+ uptake regulation protein
MSGPGTLRITPQRRVILEELRSVHEHPTAREVFDRVRVRLPHISLGTVYRNLEILSRRGMIRTLELGCTERRYDGDTDDHYHLCCIRCGRIEDAPMAPLAGLEEALDATTGYALIGHRLEFKGICPGCQAAQKDAGGRGERGPEEETAR